MIVCVCNDLSLRQVREAIAAGCQTYEEALKFFGCDPFCETCRPEVNDLIRERFKSLLPKSPV